jgi:hypothetical protein
MDVEGEMSETKQDIIEAIEAKDVDRLRSISDHLSMDDEPGDRRLSMRVALAAAILEVAKLGDELAAEDEHALDTYGQAGILSYVADAVESCDDAAGAEWPSGRSILAGWMFDNGDEDGEE